MENLSPQDLQLLQEKPPRKKATQDVLQLQNLHKPIKIGKSKVCEKRRNTTQLAYREIASVRENVQFSRIKWKFYLKNPPNSILQFVGFSSNHERLLISLSLIRYCNMWVSLQTLNGCKSLSLSLKLVWSSPLPFSSPLFSPFDFLFFPLGIVYNNINKYPFVSTFRTIY